MKLLCLGDIAISPSDGTEIGWVPPNGVSRGDDTRILFNCELPLGSEINLTPRSSGPRLLANPQTMQILHRWAPGFTTLATNHILDAGKDGLLDTIRQLRSAGFTTIGAGPTPDEISNPLIWETDEGRLAIINWVFPETHPEWNAIPGPNCWPGIEEAKSIIQYLKSKVDWVMIVAHWSDELFPYPRPQDREIAGELAKAGAHVLVSHHPHVVRGMEKIGICSVYYSIGNFYFSDYQNDYGDWIVKTAPRNREALGIYISFRRGMIPEYQPLSFWQVDGRVIKDPLNRAVRRMEHTSNPLKHIRADKYENWYLAERSRFNRYGAKWHFGVRRLGIYGLFESAMHRGIRLKGKKTSN